MCVGTSLGDDTVIQSLHQRPPLMTALTVIPALDCSFLPSLDSEECNEFQASESYLDGMPEEQVCDQSEKLGLQVLWESKNKYLMSQCAVIKGTIPDTTCFRTFERPSDVSPCRPRGYDCV